MNVLKSPFVSNRATRDSGFVLLSVLLGLLILGGLGVVSVGVAVTDVRMARNVIGVAEARGLVEQDITQGFESVDPAVLAAMPVGSTLVTSAGTGGTIRRTAVWRASDYLFLIGATVDVPAGPYRGDGLVFRLALPTIGLERPVSAGGPVQIGSGIGFAAVDTETDADCGPGSTIPLTGLIGEPSEDLEAWRARATVWLADGVGRLTPEPKYLSRECDRADAGNWGDPAQPNTACGRYLPVILAPGDLEIDGGVGQGVLIVDGDLHMTGGVEFHGLVLVGGRLVTSGSGARIIGAVQVVDWAEAGSDLNGESTFTYSPCAIGRALTALGRLETLSRRSWIGMY